MNHKSMLIIACLLLSSCGGGGGTVTTDVLTPDIPDISQDIVADVADVHVQDLKADIPEQDLGADVSEEVNVQRSAISSQLRQASQEAASPERVIFSPS